MWCLSQSVRTNAVTLNPPSQTTNILHPFFNSLPCYIRGVLVFTWELEDWDIYLSCISSAGFKNRREVNGRHQNVHRVRRSPGTTLTFHCLRKRSSAGWNTTFPTATWTQLVRSQGSGCCCTWLDQTCFDTVWFNLVFLGHVGSDFASGLLSP